MSSELFVDNRTLMRFINFHIIETSGILSQFSSFYNEAPADNVKKLLEHEELTRLCLEALTRDRKVEMFIDGVWLKWKGKPLPSQVRKQYNELTVKRDEAFDEYEFMRRLVMPEELSLILIKTGENHEKADT